MTNKEENIVNIAMKAAELLKSGKIEHDEQTGFLGMTEHIIKLADQFEQEYGHIDYNAGVPSDGSISDYWEDIDRFAEKELLAEYAIEEEPPLRIQLQSAERVPQRDLDRLRDVLTLSAQESWERYGFMPGHVERCSVIFKDNYRAELHAAVPAPGRKSELWISLYDETGKLVMENDALSYGMKSLDDSFCLETDIAAYEGKLESLEKSYTKPVHFSEIAVAEDLIKKLKEMLQMSGPEIYAKYGLKRDETITNTLSFDNGYTLDVKLVVCEEDLPYIDLVLFDENGCEIACDLGGERSFSSFIEFETEDAVYCGKIKCKDRRIDELEQSAAGTGDTVALWARVGTTLKVSREVFEELQSGNSEVLKDVLQGKKGQVILDGETYFPDIPENGPLAEMEFDIYVPSGFSSVAHEPPKTNPLQVKVIMDSGLVEGVLKDQDTPIEVEVVAVDKDYEDYDQLQAYRDSLYENNSFRKCDFSVANFEDEEHETPAMQFPPDPIKVFISAGSVKHEIFSGTPDECTRFCDDHNWVYVDENRFEWDLHAEPNDDFYDKFDQAVDHFTQKSGPYFENDHTKKYASELIFCHLNDRDSYEFSCWTHLQEVLGEKISYDEYAHLDASYNGDPLEIIPYDDSAITGLKEKLNQFRGIDDAELGVSVKPQAHETLAEKIQNAAQRSNQQAAQSGIKPNLER